MRSVQEIYEMREAGLFPCQYPGCRDYGNRADWQHGIICESHTIEPLYQYGDAKIPLADLRAIEYDPS
jgi:hypothetical protein